MTFGEWIAQIRRDRGLSQRQVAAKTEVSGGYISQIENNHRPPSSRVLQLLASIYRFTAYEWETAFALLEGRRINEYFPAKHEFGLLLQMVAEKNPNDEDWERLIRWVEENW
jgi:transcriptional regulator with XRE-family HTH domain